MSEIVVDETQVVGALGALAHENRLAVYRMLIEQGSDGLPAGLIAERLGISPSSLTFHLQQLLHAHLVTQRRASRQIIYAANFAAMNGLVTYLTKNCCVDENCCGREAQAAAIHAAKPIPTRRKSA